MVHYGVTWYFALFCPDTPAETTLWAGIDEDNADPRGLCPIKGRPDRHRLTMDETACSADRAGVVFSWDTRPQAEIFVGLSVSSEEEALSSARQAATRGFDQLRSDAERAQRDGDLSTASELLYGKLPKLNEKVEELSKELAEIQKTKQMLKEEVGAEDIAEIVGKWTGVPVSRLIEGEVEKLIHMEDRLHVRVVGQEDPIHAVSNALRRSRAGLSDPNRPIGSFLFLGPTGVGKTELARALAEFMFDDEHAMIRIDMSEYMEKHTVSRLLGAPPGYIGYEEGGQLSEAVRRRPYSVILFDEIEKAHTDVFNVLLQILDDGRLTDGQGRTVDFKNTIIIMTSNLGSHYIQEYVDRPETMEERVMEVVRESFRPEFLNRIDETIIFKTLGLEEIKEIVDIQIEHLRGRLEERKIELELTPEAKDLVAEKGYDPVYGARPLKRTIQKLIQDPLATEILKGTFKEGDDVVVDVDKNNELVLSKAVKSKKKAASQ